jgi:hypothetical protein
MQFATTKSKFRPLSRARTALAIAIAVPAIAILSSPAAMAADDLASLASGAATEMTPVKAGMVTVGIVLVGVAALTFGIYKIISMSGGRK